LKTRAAKIRLLHRAMGFDLGGELRLDVALTE
jgi:hypothetical protein